MALLSRILGKRLARLMASVASEGDDAVARRRRHADGEQADAAAGRRTP